MAFLFAPRGWTNVRGFFADAIDSNREFRGQPACMSISPELATGSEVLSDEHICIRGARVHNLRSIDLDIPRNKLVVLTGPSGSGKSSLAFDTIFAEGQRQFIESLAVSSRQYVDQLERPDVDLIAGLQPTVCINQRAGSQNPRSTVATVTEIYDFLRVLMARLGEPHCPRCGEPILRQSQRQIEERLMSLPEGTRLIILAPIVRGERGDHNEVFARVRKAGLLRSPGRRRVVRDRRCPRAVSSKVSRY